MRHALVIIAVGMAAIWVLTVSIPQAREHRLQEAAASRERAAHLEAMQKLQGDVAYIRASWRSCARKRCDAWRLRTGEGDEPRAHRGGAGGCLHRLPPCTGGADVGRPLRPEQVARVRSHLRDWHRPPPVGPHHHAGSSPDTSFRRCPVKKETPSPRVRRLLLAALSRPLVVTAPELLFPVKRQQEAPHQDSTHSNRHGRRAAAAQSRSPR
jgi:hypothetical protein